ncbi:DUF2752 domain-containing protein [Actinomadura rayongensis]|uniref:DUF2752 domain-containing protein n=1 Tax=Actinomadura rayongensis TaxID=1429076 RepID=A0A6I4W5R9_9ACTN|nr:DUF2752 domain-containing protein [Actinomadura rayongensis]
MSRTLTARRPVPRALAGPAVVAAVTVGAVTLIGLVDPHEHGHYPSCPFLAISGYYCPGCGGLRMVNSLVHGHVGAAFGSNPLAFLLLPVALYLWGRWTWLAAHGERMRSALFTPAAGWTAFGIALVYWIVRNLPFAHVLAP